ncbi:MAG TPA: hypothetical protein VFG49_02070 [Dyella sp.]|uniref:hypothetical protein n=1 Tax=Dyella sp. TaxID=1869338 RepID=UPI002D792C5C|nr:hypothetical protein [Dyella sp.]HET6552299.1 hypothetical protein [Dyella sp.]
MEASDTKSGRMKVVWQAAMACAMGSALLSVGAQAGAQQQARPASASSSMQVSRDLFSETAHMKTDLARYMYLKEVMLQLSKEDRLIDQQLLASVEDELGLYDEAIYDFPFDNRVQTRVPLPAATDWQIVDAAEQIAKLATDRRIVMVNEAHHDAHTRELTLELLPKLRAEGFNYFAAEALVNSDDELMKRGYPVERSGSQYLHEPLYGDIVRQAIKLGFQVVAYESEADVLADREAGQANLLYRQVFAKDPKARLFVHAGYAHIDKAPGNLGGTIKPMAMQLKQLTGFDPLTVDQTRWRDIGPMPDTDPYKQLFAQFPVNGPSVLINRQNGSVWASDPERHDVDVILPPSGHQRRPHWLALDGARVTRVASADMCRKQLPCVVEARYANESDDAIPADRYTFLTDDSINTLYLRPGEYRVVAKDREGRIVGQRNLTVDKPGS